MHRIEPSFCSYASTILSRKSNDIPDMFFVLFWLLFYTTLCPLFIENCDIILRWQKGEGAYNRSEITVGIEMIDEWKVITSYVGYDHAGNAGKDGKRKIFSKIDILPPATICNETYLVIGSYKQESQANANSRMKCNGV